MNRKSRLHALVAWGMWVSTLGSLGCDEAPKPASKPPSSTKQVIQEVPEAAAPAVCEPIQARALHESLECLTPGMPPERVIVLGSRHDVQRYAKRAGATCVAQDVDFTTHIIMAYKATAPCSLTVEDSLCSTGGDAPPEYTITMTSKGFCEKTAEQGRYWALPRPRDTRFGLKRQRRRLP